MKEDRDLKIWEKEKASIYQMVMHFQFTGQKPQDMIKLNTRIKMELR